MSHWKGFMVMVKIESSFFSFCAKSPDNNYRLFAQKLNNYDSILTISYFIKKQLNVS